MSIIKLPAKGQLMEHAENLLINILGYLIIIICFFILFTPLRSASASQNYKINLKDNQLEIEIKDKLKINSFDEFNLKKNNLEYENNIRSYKIIEFTDGIEIDITLKKKPKSNIKQFYIYENNLDFYYQGSLKDECITDCDLCTENSCKGAYRSNDILYSYAVYQNNNKQFHIYRPLITDSIGSSTYGILSYKFNILSVTIPEYFFENAVYPIYQSSGLFIGYQNSPATALGDRAGEQVRGMQSNVTMPQNGLGVSISIYADGNGNNVKCMVFNDEGEIIPFGITEPVTMGGSAEWATTTFSTQPNLQQDESYPIGCIWDNTYNIYYDSSGGTVFYDLSNSYSNPQSVDLGESGSAIYGVYLTYEIEEEETATSTNYLNNYLYKSTTTNIIAGTIFEYSATGTLQSSYKKSIYVPVFITIPFILLLLFFFSRFILELIIRLRKC